MKWKIKKYINRWRCFRYAAILKKQNILGGKFQDGNTAEVIVSLTSYGHRLQKVYLTIESLFKQTLKPQYVYLWLSKKDCSSLDELPIELKRLMSRGLYIGLVNEDLRSYKKLVHTYEKCIEDGIDLPIITVDDDRMYEDYFIRDIISKAMEHPKCTICYRGHYVTCDADGNFNYRKSMKVEVPSGEIKNLVPTGVGGIYYPFKSLSPEISDRNKFLENASDADDIWFKAVTLRNGFSSVMVKNKKVDFMKTHYAYDTPLNKINIGEHRNDDCLRKTINHFDLKSSFLK